MLDVAFGARELHPAAATTVKLTPPELAVPPAVDESVAQLATGLVAVSMVNGVPPCAAEVTVTVCAAPGI